MKTLVITTALIVVLASTAISCKKRQSDQSAAKGTQSQAYEAPARKQLYYGTDRFYIGLSSKMDQSLKPYVTKIPKWEWSRGHSAFGAVYIEPSEHSVIEIYDRSPTSGAKPPVDRKPFAVLKVGAQIPKEMVQLFYDYSYQENTEDSATRMIRGLIQVTGEFPDQKEHLYPLYSDEFPGKQVGKLAILTATDDRGVLFRQLFVDQLCSGNSETNCDLCISPKGRLYKIVAPKAQCPYYLDDEIISTPPNATPPGIDADKLPR